MLRTLLSRRVIVATALLGTVSAASAQEQPAAAARFKVLVPSLERLPGAKGDFGEDVAEELRKLIARSPRHEPIERKEMQAALKQYNLKEETMTCTLNLQLAMQIQAELVMCGNFNGANKSYTLDSLKFISAKTNEAFVLAPITAAEPKQAAAQIYGQFQTWLSQLEALTFCQQYIDSQNWAQALENCDRALAGNPNSPRANMFKAFILFRQAGEGEQTDMAKLRESLRLYERVLEISPLEQDAMRTAGIIAARVGDKEKSRQLFKTYLELNPGDISVRLAIADEQQKAGDPEGAMRVIEEGIKSDTAAVKNPDLLMFAGIFGAQAAAKEPRTPDNKLSDKAKQLYETAYGYYKQLFDAKAGDVDASIAEQMVATLFFLERNQELVDLGARLANTKAGTAKVFQFVGLAEGALGNVDKAIAAFDAALAKNDTSVTGLRGRKADMLIRAGKLTEARVAFREAITAGEATSDAAADLIIGIGLATTVANKDYLGVLPFVEAAREFAESADMKAKLDYWQGFVVYFTAASGKAPDKAAAARDLLPRIRRAQELLEAGAAFGRTQQGYAETMKNIGEYITYLNQIIKSGR